MIRAVIFDMDGVVVLSEHVFTKMFVDMINRRYSIDATEEEFRSHTGLRFEHRIKRICEKRGFKLPDEEYLKLADSGRDDYLNNRIRSIELNVGIVEFLKSLRDHGIAIGLGTNGARRTVERLLKDLKIEEYFDSVVAFEDVENPKPAPDIYMQNADNLAVDPSECLVFEDSIGGIEAAKVAGMRCVALTTSHQREDLIDADKVIDSFKDITVDQLDTI